MTFGEQILDRLSKRVVDYIGNDLQLNVQNISQISVTNEIQFSNQTACISILNPNNASLAMSTSYRLSELLLRSFINVDIFNDEINEYSQATLDETLNITLGNILKDLSPEFGKITISPPFALENQQLIVQKNVSDEMYLVKITIEGEIMILSYFI